MRCASVHEAVFRVHCGTITGKGYYVRPADTHSVRAIPLLPLWAFKAVLGSPFYSLVRVIFYGIPVMLLHCHFAFKCHKDVYKNQSGDGMKA
jgi:hypothetical protein